MREEYYVKKLDKSTTYESFEHVIRSTWIRNRDYTLIGIYHPPQGTQQAITNSNFITEFTEFLMDVTSKHNNTLTMGDFNIHMDDLEDVDSCLFHDTINAFNLKQQVNNTNAQSRPHPQPHHHRKLTRMWGRKDHTGPLLVRSLVYNNTTDRM